MRLRKLLTLGILLPHFMICPDLKGQSNDFEFIYTTDIHIEYRQSIMNSFDRMTSIINRINPDFVLTGGDNVKDVRLARAALADSLYDLYASYVRKLNMPVYSGLGNHEIFGVSNPGVSPSHPEYGKKMFENRIGRSYYSFVHKGWKFFVIDNVQNKGRMYFGEVDTAQMTWLRKELSSTPAEMPVVVCGHIPFISTMKKFQKGSLAGTDPTGGVSNSIDFFRLFEKHNLKLVLQGHYHFYEVIYANNMMIVTGTNPKTGVFLFKVNGKNLEWEFIRNE